jgi:hypothetical protein
MNWFVFYSYFKFLDVHISSSFDFIFYFLFFYFLSQFTHASVAGQSGLRRRHRTLLRDLATLASNMWDPRLVSELPSPNKYHSVLSLLGSVQPLPDEVLHLMHF